MTINKLQKSRKIPNWFEYEVSKKDWSSDLLFLQKQKDKNILVQFHAKNLYFSNGFELDDVKLAKKFAQFAGLSINSEFYDLSFILDSKNIKYLDIFGYVTKHEKCKNEITHDLDLSNLPNLEIAELSRSGHVNENYEFQRCDGLKHFFWYDHYKAGKSFIQSLGAIRKLRSLSMHRPRFAKLDGINELGELKFLEILYSRSLKDISEIAQCKKLIGLEVQNCPNLNNLSCLSNLSSLKALHLTRCGSIENLQFLRNSNIEYLNFFNTTIEDGDLSVIKSMKKLKVVHFNDKRIYNMKLDDFRDRWMGNMSKYSSAITAREYVFDNIG